jgi:hypothetical protein
MIGILRFDFVHRDLLQQVSIRVSENLNDKAATNLHSTHHTQAQCAAATKPGAGQGKGVTLVQVRKC